MFAFLMLAAGCATDAGVQTSHDVAANFSRYRSWSPVPREDEGPRSDVDRELASLVFEQIHQEFSPLGAWLAIYRNRRSRTGEIRSLFRLSS